MSNVTISEMTQQEKAMVIWDDVTICWDGVDENNRESMIDYHLTVFCDGEVVGMGAVWYDGGRFVASHGFGQTRLDMGITIHKARSECVVMVLAAIYDRLNSPILDAPMPAPVADPVTYTVMWQGVTTKDIEVEGVARNEAIEIVHDKNSIWLPFVNHWAVGTDGSIIGRVGAPEVGR